MNRSFTWLIFIVLLTFGACGHKETKITILAQLKGGKTFAVPTGTVADQFVLKKFPDAGIEYYNSVLDCSMAVMEGKADAAVYDQPILKNIAAKNEGLYVLPELLFDDNYGFAVRLEDNGLKKSIDDVLTGLKADGTYDQMMGRWFPEKGNPAAMPAVALTGENGVLRFGTAAITEPMSFFDSNKKIVGFDIEFATYVARKLGKQLEIVDMEFGAMLPALIAGKVDMIGAGLSITEERAKKVLFSQPYYKSGIAAVVMAGKIISQPGTGMKLKGINDIRDKRIGVLLGSIHDSYATKNYPKATILQYQNFSDLLFALNSDKVDVAFSDHVALPDVLSKNPELGILAPNVFTVPIAAGFNSDNDALREQFNLFLKEIHGNGIYNDMVSRWIDKGLTSMPDIKSSGTNGVLRVGVAGDLGLPFSIIQNGKLAGFDIELSTRFAAKLGKTFEPADMPFGSLIASISTNKIDIITSSMMITEEREKQIDFSDPYYTSGVSVIAKRQYIVKQDTTGTGGQVTQADNQAGKRSFLGKVSNSFYNNIVYEKRYLLILNGLRVTLLISIISTLFGTLIGALVCMMRMSKRRWLANIARVYISVIRGIPVLVLLMIVYYVVFSSVNINPVIVSVIAFGLNFGAYVSEIFRSSIRNIDNGQRESAIAVGFSSFQSFRYIILPQALRPILPVYKGEFISLIKMTSVVGYIAVQDLTKASDIIRSRTFDAFFPLIMVAVLYFVIAWLLTLALDYLEISADPKQKRNKSTKEAAL
ncbi:MAG: ABC transporter permease subunit [Bacteroidetes bacterium]|nr:ABC transporter permease subunit [Bacteroidota bacterium]